MKRGGKIAVGLAGALVLPGGLRAVTPDTPYQPIVERNVFGLRPPPPLPEVKPPEVPVPKIALQGIVNVFGKRQVLFKTLMPSSKIGEAPKETSLILAEGQSLADIEVLEINESAGSVKFKNHGQEQLLTLDKDGVKQPTSSAPGALMAQPGVPGLPVPAVPTPAAANFIPAPAAASTITTIGSRVSGTVPARTLRVNNAGVGTAGGGLGSSVPSISGGGGVGQTPGHTMTAEEQAVLIEINRKLNENNPNMPPLPPTGLLGK